MNTIQPPDRTLLMPLDNQHAPIQDTLHHLLAHHAGQALDICITRLTLAGWGLLHEDLQRIGNLRLLLNPTALVNNGDDPLEDIPSSAFTPHQTDNRNAEDAREEQLTQTEALIASLQQEHVEVRLTEQTQLHTRCFLFYADQESARIAPQTAIVGSSDLTRAGLLTNAELNVLHRAHLTHEDIALKRLRGLLKREEHTLLLQCTQEQHLLAARLPTLLLLEHLTAWFAHPWEHATDGKRHLIAHLQTHKTQPYSAPMKQHDQPGRTPEEAQPPQRKNVSAPLSDIPREETWAEHDYTQHQRD